MQISRSPSPKAKRDYRGGDRVAQDDKMAQQGKVGELNSLKTQRYAAATAGGHFNRIMHEDGRKYFMK